MTNLPSNTFMFNYNARDYNSTTYTFPKTDGQLFNQDLVLNKAPLAYTDKYVDFGSTSAYMGTQYSSSASNPFNRTASANSLTFIYKVDWSNWDGSSSPQENLFANRDDNYNWMVRKIGFNTTTTSLYLTPQNEPYIISIRVNSDGTSEKKEIDVLGNVIGSTTASTTPWGNTSKGFAFFAGYRAGNEYFRNKFYWMYCSLETLTNEEILQVVQYNERYVPPLPKPVPINKIFINGNNIN